MTELVNALKCEQVWPPNLSTGVNVPGQPAPHLVYRFKVLLIQEGYEIAGRSISGWLPLSGSRL